MADRRQRPLRDLDRRRVAVDQIEAIEQLAAGILALQHVELQPEILAHAVLGRPHLRIDDLHDVAAGRQRLQRLVRLDGGGVEGFAQSGHDQESFCSAEKCGIASANAAHDSAKLSGRP